jgi:penicillin-binding protein 2
MADFSPAERSRIRVRLLLALMLSVQGGLAIFLWNLQVVRGHDYQANISRQSLRRIRHPGQRGRILDRNDIVLADNRPSVGIALYLEELRVPGPASRTLDRIEKMLDDLAVLIELPRTLTRAELADHYHKQRLLPLFAWRDLDDAAIARWAERAGPRQGVDLLTETVRVYPYNDLLAQTIGYVGRGGMASTEEGVYDFYLPEMEGKSGLELVFDSDLRGEAGGELVRIDVSNFRHNVEASRPSVPGRDVGLTIDARIQRLCERILGDETGSIVLLDPRNGDVLALATHPRFDLNGMVPFIPNSTWERLLNDPRNPLVNRPVREQYAPGSTLKPFVCLAALLAGKATPDTVHTCEGVWYPAPGAAPMHCNNRIGHGPVNMREAVERSCNIYMFKLSAEMGYAPLLQLFSELGLGRQTGIETDAEVSGILPTDAWKLRAHRDRLRQGDIANISIGQGFLTVTPLQMAVITAALANGGTLHRPSLLRGFRSSEEEDFRLSEPRKPGKNLGWPADKVETIRSAMRDVVMSPRGTARNAQVEGLDYAAKTGTAQYGPPGNRRYRSWIIAFAPYDNPRVAAVVLIDSGLGSGVDASPRIKLLFQALFGGDGNG